jgi:hypothetical protein
LDHDDSHAGETASVSKDTPQSKLRSEYARCSEKLNVLVKERLDFDQKYQYAWWIYEDDIERIWFDGVDIPDPDWTGTTTSALPTTTPDVWATVAEKERRVADRKAEYDESLRQLQATATVPNKREIYSAQCDAEQVEFELRLLQLLDDTDVGLVGGGLPGSRWYRKQQGWCGSLAQWQRERISAGDLAAATAATIAAAAAAAAAAGTVAATAAVAAAADNDCIDDDGDDNGGHAVDLMDMTGM